MDSGQIMKRSDIAVTFQNIAMAETTVSTHPVDNSREGPFSYFAYGIYMKYKLSAIEGMLLGY